MNAKLFCVIAVLVGASAIGGCASMKGGDSTKLATTAVNSDNIDQVYVARVERQARERGIEVQWIHPPLLAAH
jgi:5,10-methylene-tetrahydrofolate dehydrogenase/methenyl tetrahydrofolate cyclohydrolase